MMRASLFTFACVEGVSLLDSCPQRCWLRLNYKHNCLFLMSWGLQSIFGTRGKKFHLAFKKSPAFDFLKIMT